MEKRTFQQQVQVKKFFDSISEKYTARYEKNTFLKYFFQQRLQVATTGFNFDQKRILDIGAGTGALFQFLKTNTHNLKYFGTDISEKMLQQSGIPKSDYFVGNISELPPQQKFDFIFLLGVTTYFSKQELKKHLDFIDKNLTKDGYAVISFTNKNSFDFRLRQILKKIISIFRWKKKVIGQSFKIFAYPIAEIEQLITPTFLIEKKSFLNQTIFPFNRLFPKTSISFGNFLKKNISSNTILSWMSSDYLVFLKKIGN